jgi:hypothetical protein
LPTSGKQFAGWIQKRPDVMKARVKTLIQSWSLPPLYKTWAPDVIRAVVYELTRPAPQPVQQPVPQPAYDRESDHQAFMRKCEQKKREQQATAAAWAAGAGRGAYLINNGNGRH